MAIWLMLAGAIFAGRSEATELAQWRDVWFWTSEVDCVLRAERLNEATEAWSLDVCETVPAFAGKHLSVSVVDDELYVRSGEHVLALDPGTGDVRGQWLGGVPEPKDPAPSPTKKNDGCDCTFAHREPPTGLVILALIVGAGVARSRGSKRKRSSDV